MTPKNPILPYLALGMGILALGFSALFVRWADAPGPVTGFYRISMAAVALTPAFARRAWAGKVRLNAKILALPVLGGLFSAFDHAIWNTSLRLTSASNATLLNNTAPLWVALFVWLVLGQRLKGGFWLGLGLTLGGAVGVLGSDFLSHPALGWGDLLALFSALFYAGYFLVTQRGRRFLDTLTYIYFASVSSALALLVMSLLLGLPLSGYPARTYLAFLGAALISQVGGYLSVGYALGHLPAAVVSPTMIGQPVMTTLLAILLLGERLGPAQWLGGLGVLAGVFLVHRSQPEASPTGDVQPPAAAVAAAGPVKTQAESGPTGEL
jgi:drug/metabolite transporter (DMT)-like permease